jgi:hypothetical protein
MLERIARDIAKTAEKFGSCLLLLINGAFGLWLFQVQHKFMNVYWARRESWDPLRVAKGAVLIISCGKLYSGSRVISVYIRSDWSDGNKSVKTQWLRFCTNEN